MSDFELSKVPLEQFNITLSLEDEFLEARIASEIDSTDDMGQLKEAAKKLLTVAVARQAAIRSLCKRLMEFETAAMQNYLNDESS
jgi:hypothetical protein|tara:strand:+ start:435 stop:689 length:255 start_codon:yes stop_codon:yes gene_type:complete